MNVTRFGALLGLLGAVLVLAVFVLAVARALRRKKVDDEPLRDTRLSFLAVMSFFCGLSAVLALIAASVTSLCGTFGDLLGLEDIEREILRAAARIVLYCSLVPAVAALAFALGARGVIRESGGEIRGKALSRAGVFLAIVTAFFALGGQAAVVEPFEESLEFRAPVPVPTEESKPAPEAPSRGYRPSSPVERSR